ncbi:MAG: VWA domain-containing protein [Candidatus Yanofskybacteria bacterium]|nr:VWA domain-containing protein [Candidatus Yanofskybacteria bacterium]
MKLGFDFPAYLPWLIGTAGLILIFYIWNVFGRYRSFMKQFGSYYFLRRDKQAFNLVRLMFRGICVTLIFFLLGLVLIGVYDVEEVSHPKYDGMQIVFVLDGSLSMLAEDIFPSRFDRAIEEMRNVTKDLAGRGDKLGLVIFAEIGIPYVPYLTSDATLFQWYLDTLDPALLENELPQGSNISDGFYEGLMLFTEEKKKKVLVIISDGEPADVSGPDQKYLEEKFAEAAKKKNEMQNVSLFLVGIGDPSKKSLIPIKDQNGRIVDYYKYVEGEKKDEFLLTSPNLWFLKDMASMFGGVYRHSTTGHDLKQLMYEIIENQRPIVKRVKVEERRDISKYLLISALVLMFFFPILKSP